MSQQGVRGRRDGGTKQVLCLAAEGCSQPMQCAYASRGAVVTLKLADGRSRHPRRDGKLFLRQATTETETSKAGADGVGHGFSVALQRRDQVESM